MRAMILSASGKLRTYASDFLVSTYLPRMSRNNIVSYAHILTQKQHA
jgi:hypothetical protein